MLKPILKWTLIVAGIAIAGFLIYGGVFYLKVRDQFRVSSDSMAPTLIVGDVITVNRDAYRTTKPVAGEIVAFKLANSDVVNVFRIVAVPGDRVVFPKGKLFVNEQPVTAKLVSRVAQFEVFEETMGSRSFQVMYDTNATSFFETAALMGTQDYFAVGDNRSNARDSRFLGPIKLEQIVGRVTKINESSDKSKVGKEL